MSAAPWQGGFFERMVKSNQTMPEEILSKFANYDTELQTILSEIELILNNRPLTFLYDELVETSLTPNHLIYGRSLNYVLKEENDENDVEVVDYNMNERCKYVNKTIKHFYDR